jgi:hypothetical protein
VLASTRNNKTGNESEHNREGKRFSLSGVVEGLSDTEPFEQKYEARDKH